MPEVVPLHKQRSPCPERIALRPGFNNAQAKRTLATRKTRPVWLAQADEALDVAVAAAYG